MSERHPPPHEVVRAWRQRQLPRPSSPALLDLFERGFQALWRRGRSALGEVTLVVILERVLRRVVQAHPHLSALAVTSEGLRFEGLHPVVAEFDPERLEESLVVLVEEWLRVLGALTGEVLSAALREELLAVEGTRSPR
ncbi:hypothetical protein SAMN04488504_110134 [Myxococcus virescens]|uniref:RsbT co-antagonist protein RsbRD N-terminal domain-containing protein n=1 Tax=Myxococcus virescens TaxID=83456 RepID=A0ABY0N333_9BACT|nr:hypothetical protein SAMN04488504_110134 [Myxococcus virescens]